MISQNSIRLSKKKVEADTEASELREQERQAREKGDNTQLAAVLCQIGTVYHKHEIYDEAVSHLQEAEDIVREMGDKAMLATILNNSGVVYDSMGQCEDAIFSLEEALFIICQLEDMNNAAVMCENIADLYVKLERFTEAIQYLQKSLGYYRQVQPVPDDIIGEVEHKMETCHNKRQAEITVSLAPVIAAIPAAEASGEHEQACGLLLALGDMYYGFEQYPKAIECYHKLCARVTADSPWFARAWHTLGTCQAAQGNLEGALQCLTTAENTYRAQTQRLELALCLNDLGGVCHALGQGAKADKLYKEALDIAENLGHLLLQAGAHENYAMLLESSLMNEPLRATKHYEKALFSYQKAKAKEKIAAVQEMWKACKERTEI